MLRKLLQQLLLILIAFGFLSYLGFSLILSDIEQNERHNQRQLLTDIRTQINFAYGLLDKLLVQKRPVHQQLHQLARSLIEQAGDTADLKKIQKILQKKAGYPVDLYIVNARLKIIDTTFSPDQGLDFKLPPFIDVRQFFAKAKKTGQIMVGQPNMEFTSKQFKIYTYSVLSGQRYLELGLIDADVNGYFHSLIDYLYHRDDAQITLFYEFWDELLVPLSLEPENPAIPKMHLFKQNDDHMRLNQQAFHNVTQSQPYHVYEKNSQGHMLNHYYIEVPGLSAPVIDQLAVRFLAKITFNDQRLSVFRQYLQLFLLFSALLSIFGMIYFAFYIRRWLIRPLNQVLTAIEVKQQVKLPLEAGGSHEIQKIAVTYNDTLEHLQQSMQALEKQTTIDHLTGLNNRRQFSRAYQQELSRARRNHSSLALAMIDLDNFKGHNDHYGHQQGDQILIALARLMKKHFRRPSDHLCRMGGDEFSVLVVDTPESEIVNLFTALQQDWRDFYNKQYKQDAVTLSIGIYIFNSASDMAGTRELSWDEAYQQADKALYDAKENGRDQIKLYNKP